MRRKLREAKIRMRESNGERIPIIPIYTYEAIPTLTIAKELYDRGVYVNPSLPPATALTALRILEQHPELPETLQQRALFMRRKLREANIRMRPSNGERIPIIPIYTYEPIPTLTVAKALYDRGVYVNSSLPPATAPSECLLRTSLMATHTEALIEEAVDVIAEVLREHHIGE
jgi:7-keto-8-aminopelargonate synthetase-like enzyme